MNDHTLTVLEYSQILSRLAQHARSEPGRDLALRQLPNLEKEEILDLCGVAIQALRLLENPVPDLSIVTDVSGILKRLALPGTVLEPAELYGLLQNQQAVRQTREALRDRADDLPALTSLAGAMSSFPEWERWIESSISVQGDVLDAASPELAGVRKELRSCRSEAANRLEGFIRERSVGKVIQDQYVTLRNGRFVVPAKPEYHRAFDGVVQDTSQSGQTVFVEPLFAVPLNNRFTVASAREEKEIQKALTRMSEGAAQCRQEMERNLGLLGEFDLWLAKARLGVELDGIVPILDDREAVLVKARHPLLALEPGIRCVPIDIRIGGPGSALIITGPNTGGKTVALKTLGLLTLMVQSGIPVPVSEDSRFRVFEKIFADIGDEQSLTQNLSTFSGHMKIIADLYDLSDENSLVLLDELGAGTDPQEGSALSIALLEALHRKGACAVATTHHNLLKEFAFRAPFADNASTVFDDTTLEPTYRLRTGTPGRSHALEVAEGLGLGNEVIERAREVMGSGAVRVDELLGRLTEEVDRESVARERAEKITERLEVQQREFTERQQELSKKVREVNSTARRQARALLRDIERRGKEVLRRIENSKDRGEPLLRESVQRMEKEIEEQFPPAPRKRGHGPITPGGRVEVLSLGVFGSVTELLAGGRDAEVSAGGVRMRVPVQDLSPVEEKGPTDKAEGRSGSISYDVSEEVPSEINLVGTSVSEALESLDRLLDRSLMMAYRSIRIVHGKGTGALKQAITRALRDDPRVSAFGPAPLNQGGAGVTVVELKE